MGNGIYSQIRKTFGPTCDWSSIMCTAHPSGGSSSIMGTVLDALASVAKSSAFYDVRGWAKVKMPKRQRKTPWDDGIEERWGVCRMG